MCTSRALSELLMQSECIFKKFPKLETSEVMISSSVFYTRNIFKMLQEAQNVAKQSSETIKNIQIYLHFFCSIKFLNVLYMRTCNISFTTTTKCRRVLFSSALNKNEYPFNGIIIINFLRLLLGPFTLHGWQISIFAAIYFRFRIILDSPLLLHSIWKLIFGQLSSFYGADVLLKLKS